MKKTNSLLEKYKNPNLVKSKITNERQVELKKFLDVKKDPITMRKGKEYVPMDAKTLSLRLAHIPTEDLHAFYMQCTKAKHFGKFFGWAIKPQK